MDASGKRVEIHATDSTEEDRLATLIAFRENAPVVILRNDGTVFATVLPNETKDTEQVEVSINPLKNM